MVLFEGARVVPSILLFLTLQEVKDDDKRQRAAGGGRYKRLMDSIGALGARGLGYRAPRVSTALMLAHVRTAASVINRSDMPSLRHCLPSSPQALRRAAAWRTKWRRRARRAPRRRSWPPCAPPARRAATASG